MKHYRSYMDRIKAAAASSPRWRGAAGAVLRGR